MKHIVLKYGLISGAILGGLMVVGHFLFHRSIVDLGTGELIGYASMVLAFLFVYFGVRAYRDDLNGGAISFGRAMKVGILITLVTCAIYVVAWEVIYFTYASDFKDVYAAAMIEEMREDGASAEEIASMEAQMEQFGGLYDNPLFNSAITFLEVFPVGLVMTVISAATLRRKEPEPEHLS